jgi:hypothetical protein
MAQQDELDNASQSLTSHINLRTGAMENNSEELVKVIEDLKSSNDQLMQKQDHMFNKLEEIFSFLKSIATLGTQPVLEGGKMSNVVVDKMIAFHDGNMVVISSKVVLMDVPTSKHSKID